MTDQDIINQAVAQAVGAQIMTARAEIEDARAHAQAIIDGRLAEERNLVNDVQGFRLGIIAPAFRTEQATALVRDPLRGVYSPAPAAPQSHFSILGFAIVGAALYVLLR